MAAPRGFDPGLFIMPQRPSWERAQMLRGAAQESFAAANRPINVDMSWLSDYAKERRAAEERERAIGDITSAYEQVQPAAMAQRQQEQYENLSEYIKRPDWHAPSVDTAAIDKAIGGITQYAGTPQYEAVAGFAEQIKQREDERKQMKEMRKAVDNLPEDLRPAVEFAMLSGKPSNVAPAITTALQYRSMFPQQQQAKQEEEARKAEQRMREIEARADEQRKTKLTAPAAGKAGEEKLPSGVAVGGDQIINGMSAVPGVRITNDDVKTVKEQKEIHDELTRKLRTVISMTSNGIPLFGPDAEKVASAMNEVLMTGKEAARLGVLNGPDLAIMTETFGNPSSFKTKIGNAFGLKNLSELLKEKIESVGKTFRERASVRGFEPVQTTPAGTIVNGYRFKGGDRNKPENWEKVQ